MANPTDNLLLAALPAGTLDAITSQSTRIELRHSAVLHAAREPMTRVLFPLVGMLSIVADLETGDSVEVGIITREGLTGVPYDGTATHLPFSVICQIPGEALAIGAPLFHALREGDPAFRAHVDAYARLLFTTTAQVAVCQSMHSVDERLAKWLLFSRDAACSDHFTLTQEYLALMMGVRRPTVTLAALALQHADVIAYSRGKISLLDGPALERRSCDCYRKVTAARALAHLAAPPAGHPYMATRASARA